MASDSEKQAKAALDNKNSAYFDTPNIAVKAKPEDYTMIDFTNSNAMQQFRNTANQAIAMMGRPQQAQAEQMDLAAYQAKYNPMAMKMAGVQALANVRGIGDQFGSAGAAQSGAAQAAAAEGAANPFYAAQQQMAQADFAGQQFNAGNRQQANLTNAQMGNEFNAQRANMWNSTMNAGLSNMTAIAAPTITPGMSEADKRAAYTGSA